MVEDIFEKATRGKFRFEHAGLIGVEELWDLSLEGLDSIFKQLNSQLKQVNEESLLEVKSDEDEKIAVKVEIIRHIVAIKLAEQKAKEEESERAAKKQQLYKILQEKQIEEIKGNTVENIQQMIDEL